MPIRSIHVLIFGILVVCLTTLGLPGLFADDADDQAQDETSLPISQEEPTVAEESMVEVLPAVDEQPAVEQVSPNRKSWVKQAQAIEELPEIAQSPAVEQVPLPVAEPESVLDELPRSGYLELLESGNQEVVGCNECGNCGECESGGCGDCAEYECGGCGDCVFGKDCFARTGDFWIRADYLMWFAKGGRLPPLITTSPAGSPIGIWGEPDTEALFGASRVNSGGRSGARFTAGYWLDSCNICALEGDYFDLGRRTAGFSGTSSGDPVFARPYRDYTNTEFSRVIAYPGQSVGWVKAEVSDYFESTGLRVRRRMLSKQSCYAYDSCGSSFRLDLISGYRYYRLVDRLTIRETRVLTGSALGTTGTMYSIEDVFRTSNEFIGGEVGLVAQFRRGRWSLELLGKMGLGNNRRVVVIDGTAGITAPGSSTANYNRGTLALPSNMGLHKENEFVIIPQFGLEVGYQLNDCMRANLGYNFLYWTDVARAGDQVDRTVDAVQFPPNSSVGTYPAFGSRLTDFWAQGLNVGVELRF